ncbi:hypothetical protein CH375_20745 [Leptospira ellisii]|nr:hypothetical protein CH379_21270 [Leptospira ellisii]PKA02810.1 hypothetical protein CH375_20745 [Leptospira ellisii]
MTEAERAQYNLLDDLIGGLGSVVSGIGRGVKSVWDGVFGGDEAQVVRMMPIGGSRGSMAQDPIANRYGINGPEEKSILSTIVDWFSTSVLGNKPESFDAALALMRSGSADARKAAGEYLNANIGKITAAQQAELDIFYHNAGVISLTQGQYQENMKTLYVDALQSYKNQREGTEPFKMSAFQREVLRQAFGGLVDTITVRATTSKNYDGTKALQFFDTILADGIANQSPRTAPKDMADLMKGLGAQTSILAHEFFHAYQQEKSVFGIVGHALRAGFESIASSSLFGDFHPYQGTLNAENNTSLYNQNVQYYMDNPNAWTFGGERVYKEQYARRFADAFMRSTYNTNQPVYGKPGPNGFNENLY